MKNSCLIVFCSLILFSCTYVLSQDLIKKGAFDIRPSEIKQNPDLYSGRLFILGGIIVNTSVTESGSLIEAIYVPVDSRGYLKNFEASNGRFLAVYPGKEPLDPLIFSEKRKITIAGEFIKTRAGKIGDMEYIYPLFEIKEIYLWKEIEKSYYYISPPYPPLYYRYWQYDPWWYY